VKDGGVDEEEWGWAAADDATPAMGEQVDSAQHAQQGQNRMAPCHGRASAMIAEDLFSERINEVVEDLDRKSSKAACGTQGHYGAQVECTSTDESAAVVASSEVEAEGAEAILALDEAVFSDYAISNDWADECASVIAQKMGSDTYGALLLCCIPALCFSRAHVLAAFPSSMMYSMGFFHCLVLHDLLLGVGFISYVVRNSAFARICTAPVSQW
jgi:hypothetical protein